MRKKGLKDMKNQNMKLIMQEILANQNISRIELSKVTGLSPSTVSSIVNELLDQGMIAETGTRCIEKGRSRKDLAISADFGAIAVFEISRRSVFFCLFDMCLQPIHSQCIASQRITGNDLLELLVNTVFECRFGNIMGVGLLLQDDIQPSDLNVIYDTGYSSAPIGLQSALSNQLHIPVCEETCSSFTISNSIAEEVNEKVNCAHIMVGKKVFATITIDGQRVSLRKEFCERFISEKSSAKGINQLLQVIHMMFDIQKIFMIGTDFEMYQQLTLADTDVQIIRVDEDISNTISPQMAEMVRNQLLLV